jgi:hypothetical protein
MEKWKNGMMENWILEFGIWNLEFVIIGFSPFRGPGGNTPSPRLRRTDKKESPTHFREPGFN